MNSEKKMQRNSLTSSSSFLLSMFNTQKNINLGDNELSSWASAVESPDAENVPSSLLPLPSSSSKKIGKHIILDISSIKNMELLEDVSGLYAMFDNICNNQKFNVLNRLHHQFQPRGITLLYLLAESHISFHSYPENAACFIDIFTCRTYDNDNVYNEIFNYIVRELDAGVCSRKLIIDRAISSSAVDDVDECRSVNENSSSENKRCVVS